MFKPELIEVMSQSMGTNKKEAEKALNAFIDAVKNAVIEGDRVQIVGFGTFEVTERSERMGRNPKTGESLLVPASKGFKFKPAKALKDTVNGGV